MHSDIGVASFLAVALLLATTAAPSAAQNRPLDSSLKGLTSVSVYIDDLDADVERDGLSKAQLQAFVELRLRNVGITVVPEAPPNGPHGYLWVALSALRLKNDVNCLFSIETRLARLVTVLGTNQTASALTWFTPSAIAVTPRSELVQHVRDVLGDQVDRFANAYLSMNRKR